MSEVCHVYNAIRLEWKGWLSINLITNFPRSPKIFYENMSPGIQTEFQ